MFGMCPMHRRTTRGLSRDQATPEGVHGRTQVLDQTDATSYSQYSLGGRGEREGIGALVCGLEPIRLSRRTLSTSRVIAGGRRIRDVEGLVSRYGGRASRWVKKEGVDEAGRLWHWYEHHGIGRVELKPK